jgi:hypothetical protein
VTRVQCYAGEFVCWRALTLFSFVFVGSASTSLTEADTVGLSIMGASALGVLKGTRTSQFALLNFSSSARNDGFTAVAYDMSTQSN